MAQGLTEFLPVSSSGHLTLLQKIFGIETGTIFFNLFLHLATLIVVVFVYRKQVIDLIKHPFSFKARMLYVACIPTVILALIFRNMLENISGVFLGFAFLFTAIILLVSQSIASRKHYMFELNFKTAFLMGVAQGVAVFPGISRSGMTLATGLSLKKQRDEVADFSFLMSIPVILGGFVLELIKLFKAEEPICFEIVPMLVGFVSALVFGFISLKLALRCVKKLKLGYFSIYLVIVSILTFVFIK